MTATAGEVAYSASVTATEVVGVVTATVAPSGVADQVYVVVETGDVACWVWQAVELVVLVMAVVNVAEFEGNV